MTGFRGIITLAVLAGLAGPAYALDLPVATDKAAHFGVSYVMTDQLMRAGLTPEQAVALCLTLGWLKEMLDARPDPGDMAADAAGALAAGYVRLEWRF